jgi:hypothetical protein
MVLRNALWGPTHPTHARCEREHSCALAVMDIHAAAMLRVQCAPVTFLTARSWGERRAVAVYWRARFVRPAAGNGVLAVLELAAAGDVVSTAAPPCVALPWRPLHSAACLLFKNSADKRSRSLLASSISAA